MALDQDIQRWVDALRGGDYQQTTKRLHTGAGFCCLGVCRDILGTEWEYTGEIFNGFRVYESDASEETRLNVTELPAAVSEFLSYLTDENVNDEDPDDYQQKLIELNDAGMSFSEIADWIEAHAEVAS